MIIIYEAESAGILCHTYVPHSVQYTKVSHFRPTAKWLLNFGLRNIKRSRFVTVPLTPRNPAPNTSPYFTHLPCPPPPLSAVIGINFSTTVHIHIAYCVYEYIVQNRTYMYSYKLKLYCNEYLLGKTICLKNYNLF